MHKSRYVKMFGEMPRWIPVPAWFAREKNQRIFRGAKVVLKQRNRQRLNSVRLLHKTPNTRLGSRELNNGLVG